MKTMINSINPFDIIIPIRQRKEFPDSAHQALKDSIRKNGLFHAPGLRSAKDPTLVFGHRRTLALQSLIEEGTLIKYNNKGYNGEIPYVAVGNLNDLQLQEIELSENIDRLDLTWQEKALTMQALENLRNDQREDIASITDSVARPVTLEELAAETKQSVQPVSEALAIAKHLTDPDVAKAKTQKEAKKIIEKKAKAAHAAQRAEAFNPDQSCHTLLVGDCRQKIKELPATKFQAIITDPPYGIEMHKDQSWNGEWHEYDDTEAYCFNLIATLLPEWDRVTTSKAHLYIFCDWSKFESIKDILGRLRVHRVTGERQLMDSCAYAAIERDCSSVPTLFKAEEDFYYDSDPIFQAMPYPFIWNKGNVASYPRPEHWPRKSFECILYAVKGNKPHNKLDLAVIDIPQTQTHNHPAGKPPELYAHLMNRSCLPGDSVLDCFVGEGNSFSGGKQAQVLVTGIELSEKYATLAKNTLTELGE